VHPSQRLAPLAAGVIAAIAAALAVMIRAPDPPPADMLAEPRASGELVALVRPGPVVYFPGPDGSIEGLDVDLLRLFAIEKKLPLRFVAVDSDAAVISELEAGQGHVGAGGLLAPAASAISRAANSSVLWSSRYLGVEPVLIYNTDGFRPADWLDLEDETVAVPATDAVLRDEIEALRGSHPQVRWQAFAQDSAIEIVARVSEGMPGYAIVDSLVASIARNVYLYFDVAFRAGGKRDLAFAVAARFPKLAADLDRFLERISRDGTLARLVERRLPDLRAFQRLDAGGLQENMRTVLPRYRALFREAHEKTGIEWRLLAALAYQESRWDPAAVSETGVRGFMQLTEDTAKRQGVTDLLDPGQSVLAAARYLRGLKEGLPARIQEPDRTWLALAAYNIGMGHLDDARVLAQRQGMNPDHWSDVKRALPLLALPEHYERSRLGYARGGMPVAFVDRVRGYYDVLLAREPAAPPRLRLAEEPEPTIAPPGPK
jgi:membrane-bound lytic murein transglycosylase F